MRYILHVVSRFLLTFEFTVADTEELPGSSRNDTNARTTGIADATQQRYHTWQEAYDAYVNAYERGTVRATPIVNGPFDPYAGDDDEAELASAFTRMIV